MSDAISACLIAAGVIFGYVLGLSDGREDACRNRGECRIVHTGGFLK